MLRARYTRRGYKPIPVWVRVRVQPDHSHVRDVLEVREGMGRRDLSVLEEGALVARRDRDNCVQNVVW